MAERIEENPIKRRLNEMYEEALAEYQETCAQDIDYACGRLSMLEDVIQELGAFWEIPEDAKRALKWRSHADEFMHQIMRLLKCRSFSSAIREIERLKQEEASYETTT